jgi:hypothetical protein
MAEELRQSLAGVASIPHRVSVFPSADYPLKSFSGIVATSDSTIIDRDKVTRVFDMARFVIENSFHARIRRVGMLEEDGD